MRGTGVLIVVDGAGASPVAVEFTMRSIGRSLGALRRQGVVFRTAVVTQTPPRAAVDRWAEIVPEGVEVMDRGDPRLDPKDDEVVVVVEAGEVLHPRFLPRSVRIVARTDLPVVIHPRCEIARSPRRLIVAPTRDDHLPLAVLLDHDPWPGAVVTSGDVLRRFPRGPSDETAARLEWMVRTLASDVSHRSVSVVNKLPSGAWPRRLQAVLHVSGPKLDEAVLRSAWLTTMSLPARVRRRLGREFRRRTRAGRRWIAARLLPWTMGDPENRATSVRDVVAALTEIAEPARIAAAAWQQLRSSWDVIIVTPRVSTHSSDRAALALAGELDRDRTRRVLLITTGIREHSQSAFIPGEVHHLPLPAGFTDLTAAVRTRVIQQIAALVSSSEVIVVGGDLDPSPPSEVRWTVLESASNPTARRALVPLPVVPEFSTVTQYTAAHDDAVFDAEHPFRILWRTSVFDPPTRQAALARFSAALDRADVPARIHLHHETAASFAHQARPPVPVSPAVIDGGEYTGGLLEVPTEDYHAWVVDADATDARASIVQAMLLGLPVISWNAHVADLLADGDTAISSVDDPEALVAAVMRFVDSRQLRRHVIAGAYARARDSLDRGTGG